MDTLETGIAGTARTVSKNFAVLTSAHILAKFIGLGLFVCLARYLGAVNLGKYSFAVAFTGMFVVLADLGINVLIVREVARHKKEATKYLSNVIVPKIILLLVVYSAIFVVASIIPIPMITRRLVYLIGLYLLFTALAETGYSFFRAYEKMEYEAFTSVFCRSIALLLVVLVLVRGYGIIEVGWAFLAVGIVNILIVSYLLIRHIGKPTLEIDFGFISTLIKAAVPLGVISFVYTIYFHVDSVMLEVMKGEAVVGWYNAAYRLMESLTFIPAMLAAALFPVFSRYYPSASESLINISEKAIKFLIIVILPICFGATFLARKLIFVIYASNFENSILALQILIWALALVSLNYILGNLLVAINRQVTMMYIVAGALALNVGLNLLLIPRFSLIGSAVATVVSEIMVVGLAFYFITQCLASLRIYAQVWKPLLGCLLMCGFIYFVPGLSIWIVIPGAAFLYFAGLLILGAITEQDRLLIRQILWPSAMDLKNPGRK
ncbi:MAG: flippase [Actinomycetota bacterium]|nr:flippase [Actinomycetota bacterium]